MKNNVLLRLDLSKDHKPAYITSQIGVLLKEVKKITARKNVVVIVMEAD